METKVQISVVILTKNEADRIKDCIDSVRFADEILVVDDGSTDDTVEQARSLGARVLERRMDIEGKHRNWAYAQAKHEWILSLDADERLTPELGREITSILRDDAPYEIYAVPRRNYIGNHWIRYGGWYPSAQIKLFKKSVFRWEETTVHPRAFGDKECGTTSNDILHYSYQDLGDCIDKLNKQTTLEAEKWLMDGRRMLFGKALWRTIDRFFRSLLWKQGFRDGQLGWFVAWMAGTYQLLSYVKYREAKSRNVKRLLTNQPSLGAMGSGLGAKT